MKDNKIKLAKLKYPIFDTVYSENPLKQLYLIMYGTLPSKYATTSTYDKKVLDFFLSNGYSAALKSKTIKETSIKTEIREEEYLLVNDELKILVYFEYIPKTKTFFLTFYYDIKTTCIESSSLITAINQFKLIEQKSNIYIIKSDSSNGLDGVGYDLKTPAIDIDLNYGKNFRKVHDIIVKRLNTDNDKGIILLHGKPGTGKSFYIKYLTKCIENKEIYFVPPALTESLTDPAIIPFLMERKNSILIIEDGEKIITDRNLTASSNGVANILNITDGILGDCLNIQIIVTFNMERNQIDKAMTRKGRLIAEHSFDALDIEDTNKLLKSLNKNHVSDKGLTLAEIYNIDEEEFLTDKKSKIGFQ